MYCDGIRHICPIKESLDYLIAKCARCAMRYSIQMPNAARAVHPETMQPSVAAQPARVKPSMLCAGEGGAGTWSDGKLTTKVGRNSDPVRRVLHTLYTFGAPQVPSRCNHTSCIKSTSCCKYAHMRRHVHAVCDYELTPAHVCNTQNSNLALHHQCGLSFVHVTKIKREMIAIFAHHGPSVCA